MLSWLGPRPDRGRIPFLGRAAPSPAVPGMGRAARRVVRLPAAWGGGAVMVLLALAAPALGMRLGTPAIDLPCQLSLLQTLDQIQRAFPRTPSPAQVVVMGCDLRAPHAGALTALQSRGPRRSAAPSTRRSPPPGRGRPWAGDCSSAGGRRHRRGLGRALLDLRGHILPDTIGTCPGSATRSPATPPAATTTRGAALPHADRVRVGHRAGVHLAMVAFRSLAIPLISIGLNLLSVGAAYGLITLIFQDGHLQGPLGFTSFGGIIPWMPLFMFVLLFGLSMDYHVFILSRIRELHIARRQHPRTRSSAASPAAPAW